MGVVGHLMMNCDTLLDAGKQIVRYASVLSETGKWSIDKNATTYDIRYLRTDRREPFAEVEEASLSSCIRVLRYLAGKNIIPTEVVLTHSDPGYPEVYEQVFGYPLNLMAKNVV